MKQNSASLLDKRGSSNGQPIAFSACRTACNATVADTAMSLRITAERMINRGLTAICQPAEVSQYQAGDHDVRISRRNASGDRSSGAPISGIVDEEAGQGGCKIRLHRSHAHGKSSVCR